MAVSLPIQIFLFIIYTSQYETKYEMEPTSYEGKELFILELPELISFSRIYIIMKDISY